MADPYEFNMSFGENDRSLVSDSQTVNPLLDASQVLAAALEQMDTIIASTENDCDLNITNASHQTSNSLLSGKNYSLQESESKVQPTQNENTILIINALEKLRDCVRNDTNDICSANLNLNISSATIVYEWLQKKLGEINPKIPFSPNELNINSSFKVHQLESDKKNLILQTSVLADQVDAQANKISELERILDQKKDEMLRLEQNLHQEMLARSSVENSKLELMTKLSNLRLRLTAAERDRRESDDKYRKLENELVSFQAQISDNENEQALLRGKLSRNGNNMLPSADNSEMEKLKSALHSVIVSNNEKDQKIEDLRCSLTKYKKLQVLSNHTKKISDSLRGRMHEPGFICNYSCNDGLPAPVNDNMSQTLPINYNLSTAHSPIETGDKNFSNLQTNISTKSSFHKSNSEDNLCPLNAATVITSPHYGTMPRQSGSQVLQQSESKICETGPDSPKKVSSLKGIDCSNNDNPKTQNNTDKSSGDNVESSVVTFAVEECVTIPSAEKEHADYVAPITPQPFLIKGDKDKKGFMKLFSKWKKSGSQNIDRIEDFKRGGIRATAGARLGWSRDVAQEPDIPFTRWNTDMVVEWLHRLGLSAYASECKRWMCTADMLIKASANDLEKELGIKNPLHKKKLVLAIKSLSSGLPNLPQSINKLDHHWVIRWLDDIGLPQYKDAFSDARVDGRVLHCLTIEDLLFMKVTNLLHHISISRGIQLLREKGFDHQCLVRRSLPDESKSYTPQLVSAWSNHRVMEWLRTVDLSEYAPNLRGSGVHGALIIYEVRFNTNLFATLLNIPPTKTLLRRHLATHFKNIVGEDLTQLKREKETDTALTPSIKVKTSRKTQFALIKKRNKSEFENEDYVCPMEIKVIMEPQKSTEGDKLIVRRNSDPSPQDQRQIDLKTVHQDENLNESPTTIV